MTTIVERLQACLEDLAQVPIVDVLGGIDAHTLDAQGFEIIQVRSNLALQSNHGCQVAYSVRDIRL